MKRNLKTIMAVGAVVSAFAASPSFATVESVVAGCSAGGGCVGLVQTEILAARAAGATEAEVNQLIADLVTSLARSVTAGTRTAISQAIAAAGRESTNGQQQQQIASIADTVSAGGNVGENQTAEPGDDGNAASGN
ncbi:hypothetical protein [Rhizobium sp. L1K21]|uniref:hypothetical protein n=1 Tax=Rhizobium sp. L1K21 TaxID=2954933 RepID=UPI002093D3B7|nr:hypothetical protein [Rhizobium sp. L1K21]MCO6187470.1 hypothetical protein [Rhizobium sp. L1K21]